MGEFSITHILLLLVVFLIFFGPSRLPALGQSLGKAIRGFKQGLNDIDVEAKDVTQAPPTQASNQQISQNEAPVAQQTADHKTQSKDPHKN